MLTGETLFDLPGNVSTVNYVSADNWDAPCLMKFVALSPWRLAAGADRDRHGDALPGQKLAVHASRSRTPCGRQSCGSIQV
jgi:hypothetical protein